MRALSIDPGVSTGVAVVDHDGVVVLTKTLVVTDVGDTLDALKLLHGAYDVDTVVIEEGPVLQRNAPRLLLLIDAALRQAFPKATWMRPTEWKTTPRGRAHVANVFSHERDAVRMGFEHLHRLMKEDV